MLLKVYELEIFKSKCQVDGKVAEGAKRPEDCVPLEVGKFFCRGLLYVSMIIFFGYGISFSGSLKTVLIISIDALHPDALSAKTSRNIHRLMKQGSYTLDGHSTHPPKTLVSHAAMFSGISPENGGRKNNSWHSGDPRIKGQTIFNTAKSLEFSTGFFFSKEELFYIDDAIAPLIRLAESRGNYLIIITSDHAGHEKIHGSEHAEDEKLPLVMVSDSVDLKQYQGINYHVTDLKSILKSILNP